jgi:hypothetical protein
MPTGASKVTTVVTRVPALPTYRQISHANHTWRQHSPQTACFEGSKARSAWVRFPSPAPLFVAWRVLRCPRSRLSLSPSSHSLDAPTVHLIECVDRSLGRVGSRSSHPSVIDPKLSVMSVPLREVQLGNRGQIWALPIRGEDSSFVEIGRTEDRSLEHQNPDRA